MVKKNNASRGAVSSTVMVLGAILLILAVVIFVVVRVVTVKNASTAKPVNSSTTVVVPPEPVHQIQLGDVSFIFESAKNIGSVLKSKDSKFQSDLTTTEKFVKVVIGAQNKGKINVKQDAWHVGNIVDSEGRNFVSVDQNNQSFYLFNNSNSCGSLLKPEFEPTPCLQYYEVSKESKGLKIEVNITNENTSKKIKEGFIDLIVN